MRHPIAIAFLTLCVSISAVSKEIEPTFNSEELAIARFWQDMGPVLRDDGVDAYAKRYHESFRHWDIEGGGSFANKESAIKYWGKFHEDGHRITCSFVRPITVDVYDDVSVARLLYEQTDRYADGKESTGLWRMVAVFKRAGDTWQVLDTNMVTTEPAKDGEEGYHLHCPDNSTSQEDL